MGFINLIVYLVFFHVKGGPYGPCTEPLILGPTLDQWETEESLHENTSCIV